MDHLRQDIRFIEGYVYAKIEKLPLLFSEKRKERGILSMCIDTSIPKKWFGLTGEAIKYDTAMPRFDDTQAILNYILFRLKMTFSKYDFIGHVEPNKQYVKFVFTVKLRPKNMTLSDIERELGYPINIIAD